ncbi:hypothetical protein GDO81_005081 [Engystomops pustulosus]|uniref:Uncharacterized protein n=1 Tax=Engystomops pustulosus TaxID=76066 RepID=A0AAV7CKJ7_ENGPU|nr:hypothetical protein GDO81_005081 [Engystomops pustulosus]
MKKNIYILLQPGKVLKSRWQDKEVVEALSNLLEPFPAQPGVPVLAEFYQDHEVLKSLHLPGPDGNKPFPLRFPRMGPSGGFSLETTALIHHWEYLFSR